MRRIQFRIINVNHVHQVSTFDLHLTVFPFLTMIRFNKRNKYFIAEDEIHYTAYLTEGKVFASTNICIANIM